MKALLRPASGVLCAATLLLPACAPAHAAGALGYGIQALGKKPYFSFRAPAGRTVRGAVRIVSTSKRRRTLLVRAADASTGVTGGLVYDTEGPPRGPGSWIRLARSKLVLPAGGAVVVPFEARIPRHATAGDKMAGIVVSGRRPRARARGRRGFRLRFVSRLAIAVQMRVPRTLTPALRLRGAGIGVAPAGATLDLRHASAGNALIAETTGTVSVFRGGHLLFTERVDVGAFVPRTAIAYPVPWVGTPAEGEYQVHGTLRPEGGRPVRIDRTVRFDAGRIDRYRRETGRVAIGAEHVPPLLALMAGAAMGLGGVAAGRTLFKRGERSGESNSLRLR